MTIEYDLLTDADKQRISDQADDAYFRELKSQQERHWAISQELAMIQSQLDSMPGDSSLLDAKNAKLERLGWVQATIEKLLLVQPSAERRSASLTRLGYA